MNLRERLVRIAEVRYLQRGLPLPLTLWARLTEVGVFTPDVPVAAF